MSDPKYWHVAVVAGLGVRILEHSSDGKHLVIVQACETEEEAHRIANTHNARLNAAKN